MPGFEPPSLLGRLRARLPSYGSVIPPTPPYKILQENHALGFTALGCGPPELGVNGRGFRWNRARRRDLEEWAEPESSGRSRGRGLDRGGEARLEELGVALKGAFGEAWPASLACDWSRECPEAGLRR